MGRFLTTSMTFLLALGLAAPGARAEIIRGGATLSPVSSVVKISREGNGLDSLVKGEVLYVFTERGEPVSQIIIRDVFSDEIHSEPLPAAVARQIRDTNVILVFSNLREYGDFIRAYIDGSMDAFRQFIARFPRSELREEAQRTLDGLVYRPFKVRGTAEAFSEFLEKHPDNYYAANALERRDDLRFLPVSRAHRISGYRQFLHTWPDNRNAEEARRRLAQLQEQYAKTTIDDLGRYPRSNNGRSVQFTCRLHSVLPVYVEGPGVGRKTAAFKSPRRSSDFVNFQVEDDEIVLWRLFVSRENEELVGVLEGMPKGQSIRVFGVVFDILGGAPWIDVEDIERI